MAETLMKMPLYVSLKQHEPKIYEEVLEMMSQGFQRGSSEEEIASKGRALISKIVGRKLSYAADGVVLEFADIYITYMGGLRKADSASCVAIFDDTKGIPLVANLLSLFPEASAKEMDLKARILQLKTTGAALKSDAQKVDAYLSEVFEKLRAQPALKIDLFAQEKLLPSDYAPYCEAATAFLTEIRRLPTDKAATLFRYMYALADK